MSATRPIVFLLADWPIVVSFDREPNTNMGRQMLVYNITGVLHSTAREASATSSARRAVISTYSCFVPTIGKYTFLGEHTILEIHSTLNRH